MYGVHDLAQVAADASVIVTEGEKARDALHAHGIVAVGTVTGASAIPSDAVLSTLLGRPVVLWPDHDDDGRRHMQGLAAALGRLGHDDVRTLPPWPEAPPKGDAWDFFAAGGTVEGLRALIAATDGGLGLIPVGALLDEPDEAHTWIVEGRLPAAGLGLLVGKPKAGKSTAARCLAFAVARGAAWLGHRDHPRAGDLPGARREARRGARPLPRPGRHRRGPDSSLLHGGASRCARPAAAGRPTPAPGAHHH